MDLGRLHLVSALWIVHWPFTVYRLTLSGGDGISYCVVTTTTIGFGDFTPETQALRGFAVLFIPLAVGAMGHFLGTIANFIVEQRSRQFDKQL